MKTFILILLTIIFTSCKKTESTPQQLTSPDVVKTDSLKSEKPPIDFQRMVTGDSFAFKLDDGKILAIGTNKNEIVSGLYDSQGGPLLFSHNPSPNSCEPKISQVISQKDSVLIAGECRRDWVSTLFISKIFTNAQIDKNFARNGWINRGLGNAPYGVWIQNFSFEDGFIHAAGKHTDRSTDDYRYDFDLYFKADGDFCDIGKCLFPHADITATYKNPRSIIAIAPAKYCVITDDGIKCFEGGKYPGNLQSYPSPYQYANASSMFIDDRDFCVSLADRLECINDYDGNISPPASWGPASHFSFGFLQTCAVFSGTLKCWHQNGSGPLQTLISTTVNDVDKITALEFAEIVCSLRFGSLKCYGHDAGVPVHPNIGEIIQKYIAPTRIIDISTYGHSLIILGNSGEIMKISNDDLLTGSLGGSRWSNYTKGGVKIVQVERGGLHVLDREGKQAGTVDYAFEFVGAFDELASFGRNLCGVKNGKIKCQGDMKNLYER